MTLQPYSPEKLDQFALRLLDLAAAMRNMASTCRNQQIENFTLHDKKASEWCSNLERWTHKVRAELDMQIIDARAARRAKDISHGT
ncbi:MAG: hypothetical protein JXM70_26740 [Pirellulales bacterium]|nr:hypothetical protein [Pirellulales bacterium]